MTINVTEEKLAVDEYDVDFERVEELKAQSTKVSNSWMNPRNWWTQYATNWANQSCCTKLGVWFKLKLTKLQFRKSTATKFLGRRLCTIQLSILLDLSDSTMLSIQLNG